MRKADLGSGTDNAISPLCETQGRLPLPETPANLSSRGGGVGFGFDCVHRNGFDKEGRELSVFIRRFVGDTADVIRRFVENIERAIRERPTG